MTKRSYPSDRRSEKKLTDTIKLLILHTVADSPQLYLREIRSTILHYTGLNLSAGLLCGYLKEMNFCRKRMQIIAKQRDEKLRRIYREDVSLYQQHMLIFIDETGTDRRDSLRKHGYSLRGIPPKSHRMLVRGERISVIGAMTVHGILDTYVVHGSSDGDAFLDFIEKCLLPHLMPFDGKNPNSIVIMDNCSIHHVAPVILMLEPWCTIYPLTHQTTTQ